MQLRVTQFDAPLIGVEFDQGYRLVLGLHPWLTPSNAGHNLDLDAVINWLISEYGSDNSTYHGEDSYHLQCPGVWFARVSRPATLSRREFLVLVCKDVELIERFAEHFEQHFVVDTSGLLETKARLALDPFVFKPVTEKLLRQIANALSKVLHDHGFNIPWYKVAFDLDKNTIDVTLDDKRSLTFTM